MASAAAPQALTAQQLTDAPLPDYAVYTLTCAAGGNVLLVAGDPLQNQKYVAGQVITQDTLTRNAPPSSWQQWYVAYVLTDQGTRYYQLRNVYSGQLLSAPDASVGTQMQQLSVARGALADRQLWAIGQTSAPDQYQLLNRSTGLALANATASPTPGSSITQEAVVADAASQQWTFTAQPLRVYRDDLANGFFNRNGRNQGSVAFDEGTSIPLNWGPNKGKSIWVTQDSYDGFSVTPGGGLYCNHFFSYSNSLLLQQSITDWTPTAPNIVLAGDLTNRRVFHDVPTSVNQQSQPYDRPWPSVGIEIGNHVFIQCGDGRYDGGVPDCQSLYDFTETADTAWTAVRTVPQGLGVGVAIGFTAGMTHTPGDDYVYAFGSEGYNYGYLAYMHVARFLVTNPQVWEFWNGTTLGWQNQPKTGQEASIGDARGSTAISYLNGKYVLMTLSQGYNCGDSPRAVFMATADGPTKFSELKRVYDIEEYNAGQPLRYYTPGIHPEFVNGHNELLLTYSVNFSACGDIACTNGVHDAYLYRIKNIRVPYSLLGIPADPGTTPLPVTLVSFTAEPAEPNAVRLAWATASELNSATFVVEGSLDGRTFAQLGQLPAAGTSTATHSYYYLDSSWPAGTTHLYYRLRQVDTDGSATYSAVRTVHLANPGGLRVFPNPAHQAATLLGAASGAPIQVFDVTGRLVLSLRADATGRATMGFPSSCLPGFYLVRSGQQTTRFTTE